MNPPATRFPPSVTLFTMNHFMSLSLTHMSRVDSLKLLKHSGDLRMWKTNLIKLKRPTFSLQWKCAHLEFCGFHHEEIFEHFASDDKCWEKSFFMAFDFCRCFCVCHQTNIAEWWCFNELHNQIRISLSKPHEEEQPKRTQHEDKEPSLMAVSRYVARNR